MREENKQCSIAGGKPALLLWPETEEESTLSPIEIRLLRATLRTQVAQDSRVDYQIAAALVVCRTFSNYGFFVDLVVPQNVPAAATEILSRGTGHATIGFSGSDRLIGSLTFSTDGRLEVLEGYPVDGEPWSSEECIKLLCAPLASVFILDDTGKDWASYLRPT